MGQSLSQIPIEGALKTIKVRSDEHDGDIVRINADDFDERIHTRIASKKEKLRIGGKLKKADKKNKEKKSAIDKQSKREKPVKSPADAGEPDDTDDDDSDSKKKK